MSREYDWKVHEYMGNDLTGWEWEDERCIRAVYRKDGVIVDEYFDTWDIPHYSTTWEGAGLVMEWLRERDIHFGLGSSIFENGLYQASVHIGSRRPAFYEESAPLALCKAYISAMEERNNG